MGHEEKVRAYRAVVAGDWVTADELLTRHPLDDLDGRALAVVVECHTHGDGSLAQALRDEIAAPRSRNLLSPGHAGAMTALGLVALSSGDPRTAAVDLRRALELMPRGDRSLRPTALLGLAFARIRQGRWEEAADLVALIESERDDRERDHESRGDRAGGTADPGIAAARALLAVLRNEPSAAALLQEASRVPSPGVLARTVLLYTRLAAAIGLNDWLALHHLLDDAHDLGYRHPFRDEEWRALHLLAAWHVGNRVELRRRLSDWMSRPQAVDSPYYWAFEAIEARSEGAAPQVARATQRALALVSRDLDPLGRTWIHILAGTLLSQHGAAGAPDPVAGLASYEDALRELKALGATRFAQLCEAIIADTSKQISDATNDPAAVLTRQQQHVARLVTEGYTSAEIGRILHLSTKTVDFHVGNIVRRLGVRNRRGILRALSAGD